MESLVSIAYRSPFIEFARSRHLLRAIMAPAPGEGSAMKIGVPREIKTHEYRVGLTPDAVREYAAADQEVLVEAGAGSGIGAADEEYRRAGARIMESVEELFAASDMIVKVRSRSPPNGAGCVPDSSCSPTST